MGKLKSSSEDPNETTSKVTSRIGNVVWFLIKWGFRFALAFVFGFVGFVLALGGIRLPKFDLPRPNPRKFDPEKFRRELEEMRVEDLLKGFGKQLEEFDTNNKLNSEEKKVFGKLKGLDRYGLRSQLKEAISDDEMEILFLILLKLLTGELG